MTIIENIKSKIGFLMPKFVILENLLKLELKEVVLPEVTVDGSTCILFENIFRGNERWTHSYGDSEPMKYVKDVFNNLVCETKSFDSEFDFTKIETFAASKSFSLLPSDQDKWWIASKHKNALTWGLHLRAADNLRFSTDTDFDDNIRHLEFEGIGSSGSIRVFVYGWHNGQIYWANTGGSHHAAAVMRQCHEQQRKFTCKASVTEYWLDIKKLNTLKAAFYLIIAKKTCLRNGVEYPLTLAMGKLNMLFSTYHMNLPNNNDCLLMAIPKKQKFISEMDLGKWIGNNESNGNVIDFYKLAYSR